MTAAGEGTPAKGGVSRKGGTTRKRGSSFDTGKLSPGDPVRIAGFQGLWQYRRTWIRRGGVSATTAGATFVDVIGPISGRSTKMPTERTFPLADVRDPGRGVGPEAVALPATIHQLSATTHASRRRK